MKRRKMKTLQHLQTINHHKYLVMKECFKVGLYRQGLLHDLSKYSPTEFLVGCRYYQGNRSPNNAEREATGYSKAWLHHKGRNRHHFEYWVDYNMKSHKNEPVEMPYNYVAEMYCDRLAASKIYNGDKYKQTDPLEYFVRRKSSRIIHPKTSDEIEKLLIITANEGEDAAFKCIRQKLKSQKKV